ncbi:MAG: hypothetical protein HYY78_21530 [Betaproteobacteria bacterium]|nr:hypothetical protein [Betaproteobacteria bacterium]
MANDIFISFEFNRPDRTYDRVVHAFKSLCESCVEIHYGHWYLNTPQTAAQVCDRLKTVLADNDKLIVVDATNNKAAWINLGAEAVRRLREQGF